MCVCLDKFTDFLTIKLSLSKIVLITPLSSSPFFSKSKTTLSPTAIGLVLLMSFILNFPFILH